MFAGVTAARVLAPAVTSLLVALYYKYYKSVAKSDVSHHMSPYPPGGGGGSGGAPPHLQDDRAPPDLDPAVVDKILNVVNAHLDANRNFNNPAVLDEILKLLRNSDPAVLDKVEKLCSGAETETESPDMVQGSRLDHAPSDLDPAILEAIRRIDPGVLDEMLKLGPLILDQIRNQEAVSFPPGGCGGGAPPDLPDDRPPPDLDPAVVDAILTLVNSHLDVNRSFSNPAVLDEIQKLLRNFDPADDIVGKVEKLCLEAKTETEQYEQRGGGGGQNESDDGGGGGDVEKAAESWSRTFQCYPVRPEAEDCSFYLKTGTCKFGSNCKFNHPVNRKSNQVPKEREESAENPGQTECKYYLTPGGCKHGKACRYIHSREKPTVAPVVDTNFAGLPIRPGEKECAYYMRHGECKYASNCRFSHPDPVAEGGSDPSSALQGASEATCSAPRSLNETPPCVPMMIPLSPGVASYTREWNGYQSGARSMAARPSYVMNNSMAESNIYKQYPYLNQVEEFPERPGQPVCSHFLRTGDCKFKSSCKYHHPKIQTAVLPSYTHSDKGLPLRPGEKKCPYYMQNGSCKYGLNCKYNHPDPKVAGESDPVSRYGNGGPATFLGASPSTVEPSSARRSLNNTPYVPPMVIPPSQQGPSQNTELNSYQAPANLPEQSMHVPQPYWIDNSMTKTTTYQHPLKKQVEESPERPGRPVCNFFSKTGYCHKSNCNCHHPKYQTSVSPSCELSDKGLPLRPGQNICKQYSSHGICNSGPSCEFDHPPLSTFTL